MSVITVQLFRVQLTAIGNKFEVQCIKYESHIYMYISVFYKFISRFFGHMGIQYTDPNKFLPPKSYLIVILNSDWIIIH